VQNHFGFVPGFFIVWMTYLASSIDHTALKPDVTADQIHQLCTEARQYGFKTVCVPPCYIPLAVSQLQNSSTGICTVIGFPLGYQTTATKLAETREALQAGATEIDMVINIGFLKSGNEEGLKEEISRINELVHAHRALLKVIIETAYLTREEIRKIGEICAGVQVDFLKTSTGFAPKGAQVEDVQWMRTFLPPEIGIKASGGIKTYEQAQQFIAAGATRLGISSGVEIMKQATK
jgi:deoxyribose-phosphate aldolase